MDAVHEEDTAAGLIEATAPAIALPAGWARLPVCRRLIDDGADPYGVDVADRTCRHESPSFLDDRRLPQREEHAEAAVAILGQMTKMTCHIVIQRHGFLNEDVPIGLQRPFRKRRQEIMR